VDQIHESSSLTTLAPPFTTASTQRHRSGSTCLPTPQHRLHRKLASPTLRRVRVLVAGLVADTYYFHSGNVQRPDVVNVYGAGAANSGFDKLVAIKPIGSVQICTEANDNGNWTSVGCKVVNTGVTSPDQTFFGWQFVRTTDSVPLKYLFLNNPGGTLQNDSVNAMNSWQNASSGRLTFTNDFVSPQFQLYFDPNNNIQNPFTYGQLRRVFYNDCPTATVVDSPYSEPMVNDRWNCTATSTEISLYVPRMNSITLPNGKPVVIAHEIGHVLGLGHHNTQQSLMTTSGSLPSAPTSFDVSNFSNLYYTR
jgi:Matrixin